MLVASDGHDLHEVIAAVLTVICDLHQSRSASLFRSLKEEAHNLVPDGDVVRIESAIRKHVEALVRTLLAHPLEEAVPLSVALTGPFDEKPVRIAPEDL